MHNIGMTSSIGNISSLHTDNSFDILGPDSEEENEDANKTSYSDIGSPIHTSSPRRQTLKPKSKKNFRSIKILNVNCQSIRAKKPSFHLLTQLHDPDIIIGTESWLSSEINNNEVFPTEQYNIERRDRPNDPHGGVFIASKKELLATRETELETNCEILWCKFNMAGSKTLHVAAYYRPHENDEESLTELQRSLSKLDHMHMAVIGGDFNLPGWDWNTRQVKTCRHPALHHTFGSILDDHGLTQVVTEATRGENVLDLFLVSNPTMVSDVSVVPGISDHNCPLLTIARCPSRQKQERRKINIYSKADWERFADFMEGVGEEIAAKLDSCSVNEVWAMFKSGIEKGMAECIPQRLTSKKDDLPWITSKIKRIIKRRDRLSKKCRNLKTRNNGPIPFHLEEEMREIKRTLQQELRRAYWNYVESLFSSDDGSTEYDNRKRFWRFIKHNRTDSTGITELKTADGTTVSDAIPKAEALNQQFKSAFTQETEIKDDILPDILPFEEMPEVTFTTNGIEKLLHGLKTHKAAGPDGITPRILKHLAKTLAPILCNIFRLSYDRGEIPDDWREANVVPIYKKGDKSTPANYRPISLTCICCKLMEHVLASNIMRFGDRNNIIFPLQFGFRKNMSCEQQLLGFVSDLHNNLDEGNQTDVLIMDFSKAFDKVGHQRLLRKLDYYGVRGKNLKWIQNFLHRRSQRVVLEGKKSSTIDVESGVPQGSVLGPCLFLFYINDLPNGLASKVRLFADDAISYMTIDNQQDAHNLQQDLNRIGEWAKKWTMVLNTEKCKVITISRKRNKIQHVYHLNNTPLEAVTSAKYLGVTITSDLKWTQHINTVVNKANSTLAFLRRNLRIKSSDLKATAYKTLVRPIVEYASSVWDPATNNQIHQLEMVQRRAARFTLNRYHNTSSVNNMLSELEWPTLQKRRENVRLTMMYKIHNNLAHLPAQDYIMQATQATRNSQPHSYQVPYSRTESHRQSFFPRTVRDWNALPRNTVTAPSVEAFSQRLTVGSRG